MPKKNTTTPRHDDPRRRAPVRLSGGVTGDPPDDRLLTVMDVAQYLGIGRDSVFALLRTGELKSVLIRKRLRRITPDQLREYLAGLQ